SGGGPNGAPANCWPDGLKNPANPWEKPDRSSVTWNITATVAAPAPTFTAEGVNENPSSLGGVESGTEDTESSVAKPSAARSPVNSVVRLPTASNRSTPDTVQIPGSANAGIVVV